MPQMLFLASLSPNPVAELGMLASTTIGGLLDGSLFTPSVKCMMGLPGCDGSAKKLV